MHRQVPPSLQDAKVLFRKWLASERVVWSILCLRRKSRSRRVALEVFESIGYTTVVAIAVTVVVAIVAVLVHV